jgi:hypothetical protein
MTLMWHEEDDGCSSLRARGGSELQCASLKGAGGGLFIREKGAMWHGADAKTLIGAEDSWQRRGCGAVAVLGFRQ